MRRLLSKRPSPALVIAMVALFLGAGGTTLAQKSGPTAKTSGVPENSVGSGHIKNGQVKNVDIGTNAVHGRVIPDNGLTGEDINENTLGKVPNASDADAADTAGTAARATVASALDEQFIIPRTNVALTDPVAANMSREGGNVRNLLSVGNVRIDGLCRITKDAGVGGEGSFPSYPPPNNIQPIGEAEAKIIVWFTSGGGSFHGENGPRENVPPGEPQYQNTPGPNFNTTPGDPIEGEGQHQFVSASNDDADEKRFLGNRYPGFSRATGYVAATDGTELTVDMYAGLNVLGVGDNCVFGGIVQRTRG